MLDKPVSLLLDMCISFIVDKVVRRIPDFDVLCGLVNKRVHPLL